METNGRELFISQGKKKIMMLVGLQEKSFQCDDACEQRVFSPEPKKSNI